MNKKWFSIVELVIVLTIWVILVGIWFSKMWDFFSYQNTISNIDNIYKNFLKNKISANYTGVERIFYFHKSSPQFYYVYDNTYNKTQDFYISSWTLNLKEDVVSLFLASENIVSQTWIINIQKKDDIIKRTIYFSSSWSTSSSVDINNISDYEIFIEDIKGYILTWKINIFRNSSDNNLFLTNLIWENDYSTTLFLDYIKIILQKNGKNIIYWYVNNNKYKLKKVQVVFKDSLNNTSYLEFH